MSGQAFRQLLDAVPAATPKTYASSKFEQFLLICDVDLRHILMSFWNVRTLAVASKLSWALRSLTTCYRAVTWDARRFLRDWFSCPRSLQMILHECNAVISGSQALQFFSQERWITSDFDLYVRLGGVNRLLEWLIKEGYCPLPRSSNSYDFARASGHHHKSMLSKCIRGRSSYNRPIFGVMDFERPRIPGGSAQISLGGHCRRPQVVIVDVDPLEHILYEFHSTGVINFISSTKAVSVFPKATLVDSVSFITSIPEEAPWRVEAWRTKYEARGYRIVDSEGAGLYESPLRFPRNMVDGYSWVINFDPSGLERGIYGPIKYDIPFEVIAAPHELVPANSYARIVPPLVYRLIDSAEEVAKLSSKRDRGARRRQI